MPRYMITEKAGRFVAGHRNTGVGTVLDLLPLAAEYELRLGTLVPADLPPLQVKAPESEPAPEALESPAEDPVSAPDAAPRSEGDARAVEPASAGTKRKGRR